VPVTWLATLASVGIVSMIPLAGLAVIRRRSTWLTRSVPLLVSLAVGSLLGGAFLHLMPEAIDRLGSGPAFSLPLLLSFIGFFVLEKYLLAHGHDDESVASRVRPMAALNLVGDGLHNFIDGMVIAAAYAADTSVGVATTVAVFLHEVPQEIGDFGILVYSGLAPRRAVLFNAASGLTALTGAVLTLLIERVAGGFTSTLLPVAAGGFLYIAASDLVPELRRERRPGVSAAQIALMALGIALMALPAWLA
jgi:zinc and cadmium transporter